MSLAERRTWPIPPDDLPADAVFDSGRRQNWEIQHPVTMDSMYNKLTTILPINTKFVKGLSTAHDPEGSELAAGPGSTNVIPKDPPSIGKQGIHPFAAASSGG